MSTHDTPPPSTIASRGIQPRFGDLAQSCRQLVMNRLAELLTEVFSQVDDTLFECAEKAENNQVQTLFFDSMREIRRQRPTLERTYHQRIAKGLVDFLEGKLASADPVGSVDMEQLTLVENDEYEETLLITNMVNQVKSHCAQALYALEQRLALLNNGTKLSEDCNPFGPLAFARAFRETLAESPFPLRVKTVLYLLFEQKVMRNLGPLYEQLNQRLIQAGVLPNLKHRPQQRPGARPPAASAQATAQQEALPDLAPELPAVSAPSLAAGAADPSAVPPIDAGALYSGLATLLTEHRQSGMSHLVFGNSQSISSFGPSTATGTYSADELLEALNRLQQESAQDLARRMRHPQPVSELKAELHRQLEAGSISPGQNKLTEQEADVIDLVGMVFDFILDDENLPDTYKTTLSHLHTPYLKVALQDKALFTQHHHPARKLLNAMAQAGVLYGGEGEERSLLAKMHWVVEQVIQTFVGDLALFDSLLADFNEFVVNLRQKVELRERRAVEAARGRDRLLAARERALGVIRRAMNGHELPLLISNFLELSWSDALTFILLRNGEQSREWQRACEVSELLIWSVTPLDAAERDHLQAIRGGLLEDLRKGLEVLGGYHEDSIRRLLQDIVACQHAIQAEQPQVAARLHAKLPESPLGAMLGDTAEPGREAVQQALSPHTQALMKELGQIEFGAWFEFSDFSPPRRLKLSWYSPTSSNYMFVDHAGQRAIVKSLVQLALEMESGRARLIPIEHNAQLMDRAMTAIYRMLQRFTGRAPKHT